VTGEPFLALLHKFDPSLVDYYQFDKSDPESTLLTVFSLAASSALRMPNLLDPKDVVSNRDPQSLLLYLELWRHKIEQFRGHPAQKVRNEAMVVMNLVSKFSSDFELKNSDFEEACTVLWASAFKEALKEERQYLDQRSKVMDDMMYETLNVIESLENKIMQLEDDNIRLAERLVESERLLRKEEIMKKREEQKLKIEEQLKSLGEVIEEKNVEDYLSNVDQT